MRYTVFSTWTPSVGSTSNVGGVSKDWTAGATFTPAGVVAALNGVLSPEAVTLSLDNSTGLVSVTWGEGETHDLELGTDPTLHLFLGFSSSLVANGTAVAESPCLGWWHGQVATPWGGRTTRKSQDVGSQWGRNRASESSVETTGSMKLWVHRRDSLTTFAADLADIYSLTDLWVRSPIEIVDQYGNSTVHTIAESWECAPELLDDQTVTLAVETSRWES